MGDQGIGQRPATPKGVNSQPAVDRWQMATVNPKACLKVLPAVFFVIWCVNFIGLGAYALYQDASLKNQPCGMETHMWKYCMLNTVFCFFTCASFFLFPGGGEGTSHGHHNFPFSVRSVGVSDVAQPWPF